MRYLLTLAAAASLAACHNRSQDEVGAAPDRGDTTAVAADSSRAAQTDSTMGQAPGTTTADTASVRNDAGMSADSTGATVTDSTSVQTSPSDSGASSATPSDSTSMAPTDSTSMTPTDSTQKSQ